MRMKKGAGQVGLFCVSQSGPVKNPRTFSDASVGACKKSEEPPVMPWLGLVWPSRIKELALSNYKELGHVYPGKGGK